MDSASNVSPREFSESLRGELETFLESVMEAVNEAPDGAWIAGSEEQVRELCAAFRQRVFQEAVQQRIDAAEAAFSPSAGNNDQSRHESDSEKASGQ